MLHFYWYEMLEIRNDRNDDIHQLLFHGNYLFFAQFQIHNEYICQYSK